MKWGVKQIPLIIMARIRKLKSIPLGAYMKKGTKQSP